MIQVKTSFKVQLRRFWNSYVYWGFNGLWTNGVGTFCGRSESAYKF